MIAITQVSYRQDNERRNKLYGIPEPNAKVDTYELADKVLYHNKKHLGLSIIDDFSFSSTRLPDSDMLCEIRRNEIHSFPPNQDVTYISRSCIFSHIQIRFFRNTSRLGGVLVATDTSELCLQ